MDFGRRDDDRGIDPRLPDPDPNAAAWLGGRPDALRVWIGCPGWNAGLDALWPAGLPARGRLAHYATAFSTVELNATFHAVPSAATVAAWAAGVPAGFRFGVKLPRAVTHEPTGWEAAATATAAALAGFGATAGPRFFQAPPGVSPGQLPALLARIDALGGAVDALELRHPGWFVGGRLRADLAEAMAARGVAPCLSDTPDRRDVVHGSFVGRRLVLRFLGIPGSPTNRARLEAWAARARWAAARGLEELWLFVHSPDNVGLLELAADAAAVFGDAVVPPPGRVAQPRLFG